ncbi:response regulator [Pseudomonas oryzihabitans]|uniref:response regulator n=1 Tax=Pseudomonas oryzihabitans TaxID=47885 RepID=UPI0011A75DCF|nr:response regulator [Pseudomonas psychrotolerans]
MTNLHPHILVVEDEPLVRQLIYEILTDLGAVAIECDRADDGLEYLENHAPELAMVVSDILMPGRLNGHQLANIIALRWPALPVLLTSGFSGSQTHQLPANTRFLAKPWSFQQIEEAVKAQLPSGS